MSELTQHLDAANLLFQTFRQSAMEVAPRNVCATVGALGLSGSPAYTMGFLEARAQSPWDTEQILAQGGLVMAQYGRRFTGMGAKDFAAEVLREPAALVDSREAGLLQGGSICGLWGSVLFSPDGSRDHAVAIIPSFMIDTEMKTQFRTPDSVLVVDTLNPRQLISAVSVDNIAGWLCNCSPQKALAPVFVGIT